MKQEIEKIVQNPKIRKKIKEGIEEELGRQPWVPFSFGDNWPPHFHSSFSDAESGIGCHYVVLSNEGIRVTVFPLEKGMDEAIDIFFPYNEFKEKNLKSISLAIEVPSPNIAKKLGKLGISPVRTEEIEVCENGFIDLYIYGEGKTEWEQLYKVIKKINEKLNN